MGCRCGEMGGWGQAMGRLVVEGGVGRGYWSGSGGRTSWTVLCDRVDGGLNCEQQSSGQR